MDKHQLQYQIEFTQKYSAAFQALSRDLAVLMATIQREVLPVDKYDQVTFFTQQHLIPFQERITDILAEEADSLRQLQKELKRLGSQPDMAVRAKWLKDLNFLLQVASLLVDRMSTQITEQDIRNHAKILNDALSKVKLSGMPSNAQQLFTYIKVDIRDWDTTDGYVDWFKKFEGSTKEWISQYIRIGFQQSIIEPLEKIIELIQG